MVTREVLLTVEGGQDPVVTPGDLNGDDIVDLADAILALRIVSGVDVSGETINMGADVDGDDRIGLQEVLYILQEVAGLRPQ